MQTAFSFQVIMLYLHPYIRGTLNHTVAVLSVSTFPVYKRQGILDSTIHHFELFSLHFHHLRLLTSIELPPKVIPKHIHTNNVSELGLLLKGAIIVGVSIYWAIGYLATRARGISKSPNKFQRDRATLQPCVFWSRGFVKFDDEMPYHLMNRSSQYPGYTPLSYRLRYMSSKSRFCWHLARDKSDAVLYRLCYKGTWLYHDVKILKYQCLDKIQSTDMG